MSAIPNSSAGGAGHLRVLIRTTPTVPSSTGTFAQAAQHQAGPRSAVTQTVIDVAGTTATWGDAVSRLGQGAAVSGPKINRALKHSLRGSARRAWKVLARSASEVVRQLPRSARMTLRSVTGGRVFKALAKPVAVIDVVARGAAVANAKDPVREAAVQGAGFGGAMVGAAKGAVGGAALCAPVPPIVPLCGAAGAVAGGLAGDAVGQAVGAAATDAARYLSK